MPEFECSGPIRVEVNVRAGAVRITAEERQSASVEVTPFDDREESREAAESTRVEFDGQTLVISASKNQSRFSFLGRSGRIRVDAKVPAESACALRVASASVECAGAYGRFDLDAASGNASVEQVSGDAKANSASGNLQFEAVGGSLSVNTASGNLTARRVGGDVRANSASGDVVIDEVGGEVRVNTASGGIRMERVGGGVRMKSASGNVEVGELGGEFNSNTVSGKVRIGSVGRGMVEAKSVSGDVSVGVAHGTGVWMDLSSRSGSVTSELDGGEAPPDGHDLTIRVRTVSGDIEVLRAREAATA